MNEPTVFISYSSKDKKWVREYLLTHLEKNGIPCHIDFRDFEIGTASLINMEQAVEQCAKTILVFTPDWINSDFANFESLMLQTDDPAGFNKSIFPIMLQKCPLPKRLKMFTYADFTDETQWDFQLQRVIKQLKKDLQLAPARETWPALDAQHIDIQRLPQTGYELFGRQTELALLNEAWASGSTNILAFVAYGGVGKSTLVNKWAEKMRWDNYRGAEKVFAWSFYSQGTGERVTSADAFINEALRWFGDPDPQQGSAWDKGRRLARLINQHKTLLILDGMEPLQSAEVTQKGKIKDPALETLVKELSKRNRGLCLITTRERLPELDRYAQKTRQLNLEHISPEAARKLLETRRISGGEAELEALAEQFGNHALAINLLAEYLRLFPGHPLEKARHIPDLPIPDEKGRHARRVIAAFASHFGEAAPEYRLLCLLGLFDRPAPLAALNAVTAGVDFFEPLGNRHGGTWHTTLETLRACRLLFKKSEHNSETLDCHPLIREHFGETLQSANPPAWQSAHAQLYEHYKNLPEKELPDTLAEMEPLFAAVRHGCLAGKEKEVNTNIFFERIKRKNEYFILHKLGSFGSFLSTISNFFQMPWQSVNPKLDTDTKAVLLSQAGFALRAVGRLPEAAQPMKACLDIAVSNEEWKPAAIRAANLSELYLTIGDVPAAQTYGAQSVTFADRSGDGDWIFVSRTKHADALHQGGDLPAAQALFLEAETLQKKRTPGYPYLYSLQGFQFCDVLLSQGKHREALQRAQTTIEYRKQGWYTLLDIALDYLTIGKAMLLAALENGTGDPSTEPVLSEAEVLRDRSSVLSGVEAHSARTSAPLSAQFAEAEQYLNRAVDGLRAAGAQEFIIRGLLARAALFRHRQEFPNAWADLDEAREIAEYGEMRLFLVDYHLEACRAISGQVTAISDQRSAVSEERSGVSKEPSAVSEEGAGKIFQVIEGGEELTLSAAAMWERFGQHLQVAAQLVAATGYHRRDGEVAALQAALSARR